MVFIFLRPTFCIRIVADFVSRFFQFTTKFYARNNAHIYYNFGYYFYTLLAKVILVLPPIFAIYYSKYP